MLQNPSISTGTLVLVDSGGKSESLAIIVDPIKGGRWARRDPLITLPEDNIHGLPTRLVRILGVRIENPTRPQQTQLPEMEPSRYEVVRWEWVAEANLRVIAGPDVNSIEKFAQAAHVCARTGATLPFLEDLQYLVRFLLGRTRSDHDMHRMLAEVLNH